MQFRPFLLPIALSAAPALAQAQSAAPSTALKPARLPADSLEIGRKYSKWFLENQADSLVAHMDSAGQSRPEAKSQLQQNMGMLATRAGDESSVVDEKYITRRGARQFWHTGKFTNMNEPVVIRFVISPKGEIMGFGLSPLSQVPEIDP